MSELRRLLDDPGSTELERSLLRSWDHEQPSNAARERTLVALGIGAGAAVTAAAGSASAAAAAGGSIAPKAATGLLLLKWWAISTVAVGAVAGGTVYAVHERAADKPPVVQTQPQPVVAAPPMVAPLPVETTAPITTAPTDLPRATVRAPAPTPSSLTEEVAELDRARAALDANDPSRALTLADEYESRHPRGAFIQEAEVLRVQALLAKGDRAGAERAGNKFLAAYPKSPHAARVRALLAL
jgi:hypothetical protein